MSIFCFYTRLDYFGYVRRSCSQDKILGYEPRNIRRKSLRLFGAGRCHHPNNDTFWVFLGYGFRIRRVCYSF